MPKDLTSFYPNTGRCKIRFSKEEIAEFNRKHPGSLLREDRAYWFEYDPATGEETDSDVPQQDQCEAAKALSREGWSYYESNCFAHEEGQVDDTPLSPEDIREFNGYLRNCTDNQVRGCHEKEKTAGRDGYVALCEAEAARRNISLD